MAGGECLLPGNLGAWSQTQGASGDPGSPRAHSQLRTGVQPVPSPGSCAGTTETPGTSFLAWLPPSGEQPGLSAACGLLQGGHPASSTPGTTWWKKARQWCAGLSRNSLKLDDGFESRPPSAAVRPVVGYWVSPGCFRTRTRRVRDGRAGVRLSSQSPGTERPAHTGTVTAGSPPGWPSPPPRDPVYWFANR